MFWRWKKERTQMIERHTEEVQRVGTLWRERIDRMRADNAYVNGMHRQKVAEVKELEAVLQDSTIRGIKAGREVIQMEVECDERLEDAERRLVKQRAEIERLRADAVNKQVYNQPTCWIALLDHRVDIDILLESLAEAVGE